MTVDEIIKHCDDYITSMNKYADTGNIGWWLEFYHTVLNGFRELKALEEQQDVHDTCKKCIEFSEFEQQPAWIPVSDPLNELPKDRTLYVTTKFGDVETLVWDMTEWDDADIARSTIAYMDYYVPQPYKAESEEEK